MVRVSDARLVSAPQPRADLRGLEQSGELVAFGSA